jgi:hypothetical protein
MVSFLGGGISDEDLTRPDRTLYKRYFVCLRSRGEVDLGDYRQDCICLFCGANEWGLWYREDKLVMKCRRCTSIIEIPLYFVIALLNIRMQRATMAGNKREMLLGTVKLSSDSSDKDLT